MWGLLAVAFLVLPILEIYVVTQVADGLGWFNTLGLVIAISLVGAFLVRQQGFSVLGRVQVRLRKGEMPGKEIVDGMLVVVGGALLMTPGFITDVFGLGLIMPPTRAVVRTALMRRFRHRVSVITPTGDFFRSPGRKSPRGPVIDTEVIDGEVTDTEVTLGDSSDRSDETGWSGGSGGGLPTG